VVCGIFITACQRHAETVIATFETVQSTIQPTTIDEDLSGEDLSSEDTIEEISRDKLLMPTPDGIPYGLRRKIPIGGELPMMEMEYYSSNEYIALLPQNILDEMPKEYPESISYYKDNEFEIVLYTISLEEPSVIWIQGQSYPFSYGVGFDNGASGDVTQIAFCDINHDGVKDVLLQAERYRGSLRQEIYLSNEDGEYTELGDVTWETDDSDYRVHFNASYEDDYMIHVVAKDVGIDQVFPVGSMIRWDGEALGWYDENGKVTEKGKSEYLEDSVIGQAVRYLIDAQGDFILRYEAQIWAGYSEYCTGCCFVTTYLVTNDGYQLQDIHMEEYDY
jgi:hypothetical protein